ncbi:MAG: CopG family ribbon-helix-helix protein [Promethearchaeota archaeon]
MSSEKEEKKIISLQISDDLLERFEKVRTESGFTSKSEALRDAILKFIKNYEQFEDKEGYKVMSINLVYPLKDTIIDEITELYNQNNKIIKTITDWRIANKKIELLLAVGEFNLIKDLKNKLADIKDVTCTIHEVIFE